MTHPVPAFPSATIAGYPRIGPRRELKRALESHWAGDLSVAELAQAARALRLQTYAGLQDRGLDAPYAIPGDFSAYDHVLDTALATGLLGAQSADASGPQAAPEATDTSVSADASGPESEGELAAYFALARGTAQSAPLEMTKYFDTNYHYLVPEIADEQVFAARPQRLLALAAEAAAAGHLIRPVLVGPLTLLALSKPAAGAVRRPLERLDELVEVYAELLAALAAAGIAWVQLDEPILATDPAEASDAEFAERARDVYTRLLGAPVLGSQQAAGTGPEASARPQVPARPQVLVTVPYGPLHAGLEALLAAGPEALGVDAAAAARTSDPGWIDRLAAADFGSTRLVAGLVDGRNVWAADLAAELAIAAGLEDSGAEVSVSTSCSLLHVPHTVAAESALPVDVAGWLSFADEKVSEVEALGAVLTAGTGSTETSSTEAGNTQTGSTQTGLPDPSIRQAAFDRLARAVRTRRESARVTDAAVRARAAALPAADPTSEDRPTSAADTTGTQVRRGSQAQRRAAQASLDLPLLPTTTIGSFPQTDAVRRARAQLRREAITPAEYEQIMRAEIASIVSLQEDIGLDVIVHGEPERNDMVQYFAEQLDGFAVTEHGWVQSYGSRCTRPPILFGDISRPAPITVPFTRWAAEQTDKPVKGMLTGPVTILAWSFVRDDVPVAASAEQLALALSDEVADLQAAGIRIIQIDEPALRELLPLRLAAQPAYLDWAVASFRLASAPVEPSTQIHTHLCYSEFETVITAIAALDADVTSIEAARSGMELLSSLDPESFDRSVGPGIYDIHSPRVPSIEELTELLERALEHVPAERLWVNPDCGLKTRGYAEVTPALANLVAARDAVLARRSSTAQPSSSPAAAPAASAPAAAGL